MLPHEKFYLYKRENGYYYVGYFIDSKLHWKSTGEKLKTKALKVFSNFQLLFKQKPTKKPLSDFLNDFIPFAEGNYCKNTMVLFKLSINNLISIVGDISLNNVTARHIDLYKTTRMEQVTPTSVNVELRQLRSAFNTALRWKFIESNPFNKVQLLRIPEKSPVFLTKEDFEKLISTIKENWLREMIIFAVVTGMRRGEIINLCWDDVDLDRKLLNIQSNITFKTKQGKRRTIPLSEVAYHILTAKKLRSISKFVFNLKGDRISDWHVSHRFKDYVELTGLNDKLHFHSLRHTFASWLVQDGVSLYEVQKLLGHSNISVTQVYSHLQPENLHSTVNKISLQLN